MVKQIFVNLPVKNLQSSIEFFTKLGFTSTPNSPMTRQPAWS